VVILITLVTTLVTPLLLKLVYLARTHPGVKQARVTEPLFELIEEGMEEMLFQEETHVQ